MTFAASIRIYSIVYPSQYQRLQALQNIAKKKKKKKKNPFSVSFHFFNTFGVLNKEQNCCYFKYGFVEYGVAKWQ